MDIITKETGLQQTSALLVPVYEGKALPKEIEEWLGYDIQQAIDTTHGACTALLTLGKTPIRKLFIIGLGKQEALTSKKLRQAIGSTVRKQLQKQKSICIWLDSIIGEHFSAEQAAYAVTAACGYSLYTFTKITKTKEEGPRLVLATAYDVATAVTQAERYVAAVNHARDLGNAPSNYMTPEQLVQEAKALAASLHVSCEILDVEALRKQNAGALLGVNKGSSHGAYIICLQYQGNGDAPYTALVGKGLTFDSGGYNLKSSAGMRGMKFDMCGGANVLGAFELIVSTQKRANVMALVATTENKIGPDGYTCDDVLVSMSGKTIEITNTDAEGRLALCDAITYAQRKGAKRIIDMATLTGACVTALGSHYTGAFTNSEAFLAELQTASAKSEEKIWHMPVGEEFHEQVRKSDVADMTNAVIGAGGGSCLAAAFLEEFIENGVEWIHLDVAGTADMSEATDTQVKGATGVMIETLGYLWD